MDKVMDNIQRWKILADIFFKEGKNVFIRKINDDLHFCKIILNSDNFILVKNFGPEQRKDEENKIYWAQISEFDEFKLNNYNENDR